MKTNKLSVRIKYLEKELKQREQVIQDLANKPLQFPVYNLPLTQPKQAIEQYQKSHESNLVINLKNVIQDQKQEIATKDELIKELKFDSRGTQLRELKVERNAFEDEALRLRGILDNFVNQIGGIDQILNFRTYLDQQQEVIQQIEAQKAEQIKRFDDKQNECLGLEQKLLETQVEREEARREVKDKLAIIDKKDSDIKKQAKDYKSLEDRKAEAEDKLNSKIRSLEKVVDSRDASIAKLSNTIKDRDKTVQTLKSEIDALNADISGLNKDIKGLNSVVAEKDSVIKERNSKVKELEQLVKAKQQEFEAALAKLTKEK